ncbi:alcohol dehydrogenase catalytic domain-containing protein [Nocardia sp. NPDC050799]|uniref:alcohol dehydrogenase catalytic domain-containing protein n=1 Tax=Nocardia sp. NPDC050799 TaxID=3154842 RepID=UPI0033C26D37
MFDRFGEPDVMRIVEEPVVEPAAGEVRVRIEAFAVNPLDLMMRSGGMPAAVALPHARLGVEGTGIVDAVGPEVTGLEAGDSLDDVVAAHRHLEKGIHAGKIVVTV